MPRKLRREKIGPQLKPDQACWLSRVMPQTSVGAARSFTLDSAPFLQPP